jgi:hypothetical protein
MTHLLFKEGCYFYFFDGKRVMLFVHPKVDNFWDNLLFSSFSFATKIIK